MIREQLFKFSGMIASHMDDTFMIFFSDTVDEHLTHIIASPAVNTGILGCMLYHQSASGCRQGFLFLGLLPQITSQGRMADPNRVNALQSWPVPANRSELWSL
jgi:hypothetical protein